MIEQRIIASCLNDRENFERLSKFIGEDDLEDYSFIIFSEVTEYYAVDTAAQSVDIELLKEKLGRKYPKKLAAFTAYLDQLPDNVSGLNVIKELNDLRRDKLGDEIASALVQKKPAETLMEKFLTETDYVHPITGDVYEAPSLESLADSVKRENLIPIYPTKLNDAIGGGVPRQSQICIFARPDVGKCLGKGTPVLLYDGGIKKVEDIKDGDLLMGPDSLPKKVLSTSSGEEQLYKIEYPWGEYYIVNESHILSLKRSKTERIHTNGDILNVSVREYLNWPTGKKCRYKGWKTGVDFKKSELALDPYLLGLWLGDGTSKKPQFTSADPEIIAYLREAASSFGLICNITTVKSQGKAKSIYLSSGKFGHNAFMEELDYYNLINNKHIPKAFLINTRNNRKRLLAGLLDTDGSKINNGYEITQVRRELANDILFLARSLGYSATINEKVLSGISYWRIFLFGDFSSLPIRIPYKKYEVPPVNPKRGGLHFGIKVSKYNASREYYGFTVDGDGLFVLGDFTVTHNTTAAINIVGGILQAGYRVLYIGNEDPSEIIILRVLGRLCNVPRNELLSKKKHYDGLARSRGYNNFTFAGLCPGTIGEIRSLIEAYEPDVVVVDQVKNLHVTKASSVENLEEAVEHTRNFAKEFNIVSIVVTQAGESARGKLVLDLEDVYNSKTGIPGQMDLMIGIGQDEAHKMSSRVVLSTPKNKLSAPLQPIVCKVDYVCNTIMGPR